jgi:hypothetical protein
VVDDVLFLLTSHARAITARQILLEENIPISVPGRQP